MTGCKRRWVHQRSDLFHKELVLDHPKYGCHSLVGVGTAPLGEEPYRHHLYKKSCVSLGVIRLQTVLDQKNVLVIIRYFWRGLPENVFFRCYHHGYGKGWSTA